MLAIILSKSFYSKQHTLSKECGEWTDHIVFLLNINDQLHVVWLHWITDYEGIAGVQTSYPVDVKG